MLTSESSLDVSMAENRIPSVQNIDSAQSTKKCKKSQKRNHEESCLMDGTDLDQKITRNYKKSPCTDVTKSLKTEKNRIEELIGVSIHNLQSKFDANCKEAADRNSHIIQEVRAKSKSIMQQWNTDIKNMKVQEEKFSKSFAEQIKSFEQTRAALTEKLQAFRQNYKAFFKSIEEEKKHHSKEHNELQNDLKKEVSALQQKMIKDGEKEEKDKMKKALQGMLAM